MAQSGPIGILMLDTSFERFVGDVGHPDTWPFPVLYHTVQGASAAEATSADPSRLIKPFVAAGRDLVAQGAIAITTSCGFLAIHQTALAKALSVPVATSALLQVASVQAALPQGQRVGVLTFDADTLGPAHLEGAGAARDTPIVGLTFDCTMRTDILGGEPSTFAAREADVLDAAARLVAAHPEVGAIVCECTNFAPHSPAIRARFKRPVFDIVTLVHWLRAGLSPAQPR